MRCAVVVGDLGLLLEHLRERCRSPWRARRDRRGCAERLGVLGVGGEDLVPELDADVGLLDALGGELGDLEELRARARPRIGMRSASRRCRPRSFSQSRRFSYICRRKSTALRVLGVDGEDGLVGLHRLGLVRELA